MNTTENMGTAHAISNMTNLLTIKQAAEYLSVHPNTLRNWENDGKLKAVRLGSRKDRRFELEELERFMLFGELNNEIRRN